MALENKNGEELEQIIEEASEVLRLREERENIPKYIARQVARWQDLCPDNPDGWAAEIGDGDESS